MSRLQLSGSDGDLSAAIAEHFEINYIRQTAALILREKLAQLSSGDGIVDGIRANINEHHF